MLTTFGLRDREHVEWVERVVAAGGWPHAEALLVWWGLTPYGSESGYLEWVGDNPHNPGFDSRRRTGGIVHDFVLVLTERTTRLFRTKPGFVAFILGHELGHALIALQDGTTHRLGHFLDASIGVASRGLVRNRWELPHEAVCDRFGRFVAEAAEGADLVRRDLGSMLQSADRPLEAERLRLVLENEPLHTIPEIIHELRAIARPFRSELLAIWAREEERGSDSRVLGLDPNTLFPA